MLGNHSLFLVSATGCRRPLDRIAQSIVDLSIVPNITLCLHWVSLHDLPDPSFFFLHFFHHASYNASGGQCRILQSIHDSQRPLDRRPLDRIAQSIVDLSIVPNIILHSLTTDIGSYYHYHIYRPGHLGLTSI
jgi:hypothetical protein